MKYDIIIAGGGTSGCACAYTAAKSGLNTLLIEKNGYLGGTMTASLVFPAMKTSENNINNDFFKILMEKLNKMGGQITYSDGNIGWFNPIMMKDALFLLLKEAGVDIVLDCEIDKIKTDDRNINSVLLKSNRYNFNYYFNNESIHTYNIKSNDNLLLEYIETKYLVDGTGNGKIFEKLNLNFLNKLEEKNNFQPTTLRFIMSGINLKEFSDWITNLDTNREVTTSTSIDGQIHLSTAYTWDKDKKWALEPVFRSGIEEGLITEEDSNYFQLFTVPGMPDSVGFNCPRIVMDVDPNNENDVKKAVKLGLEAIMRISNFLKLKFKGFKGAFVSEIADELGIRVSNRIEGKYVYTIDDLKTGKTFENPCLISNYPVDIHSTKDGESVLEKQDVEYMLPIESLMSKDYDNLFAIGRCISADFQAQSALRIIPSCFSMGEGLAKYLLQFEQT